MEENKRTNEPIFWALFGAGGTWAAIFMPIMILLIGILLPLGLINKQVLFYWVTSLLPHWLTRVYLAMMIILPTWCALHRIHHTLHDVNIHLPKDKWLFYGIAMIITILTIVVLLCY